MGLKKFLMVHMWRLQQTQTITTAIFMGLSLAGIFYGRTHYYLHKYLGLSPDENEQVIIKTFILFCISMAVVLFCGFVYDRILRLWEEQSTVIAERDPYCTYKLSAFEVVRYRLYYIPFMKQINDDGSIDKEIEFLERWVDKLLVSDKILKRDAQYLEKWIKSEKKVWKPPIFSTPGRGDL